MFQVDSKLQLASVKDLLAEAGKPSTDSLARLLIYLADGSSKELQRLIAQWPNGVVPYLDEIFTHTLAGMIQTGEVDPWVIGVYVLKSYLSHTNLVESELLPEGGTVTLPRSLVEKVTGELDWACTGQTGDSVTEMRKFL